MQCWGKRSKKQQWRGQGWGAALLCQALRVGVGQHPDGSTMGDLRNAVGFSCAAVSHLSQEGLEGEALPLIPPSGSAQHSTAHAPFSLQELPSPCRNDALG